MLHRLPSIALLIVVLAASAAAQDRTIVVETEKALLIRGDFQQRIDARYRLFKTRNNWTFLELDTATGRMWQLQFSVSDAPAGRWMLNGLVLAADGKPGRFTLYETPNDWNYILLDQDTGRTWQAQFTVDEDSHRGIWEIPDLARTVEAPAASVEPDSNSVPRPLRIPDCTPEEIRSEQCRERQ